MRGETVAEWSERKWRQRDPEFGCLIERATASTWFAWSVDGEGKRLLVAWGDDAYEVAQLARERGGYRELRQGFGNPIFLEFLDQVFGN